MPIISSTFTESPQADGRAQITETHTAASGSVLTFVYLAPNSNNAQTVMSARVASINEMLAASEFERWITADTPVVAITPLAEQNTAQFASRLVARFHAAEKTERGRLAAWVLNRIDAGIYTDAQVRNAFGYDSATWTTYKARMTALRSDYNNLMSAAADA